MTPGKPWMQDLFNHMSDAHGLTLTETELGEICDAVDKARGDNKPLISNEAAEMLLEHASVCCGNYDRENDELGCTCCGNELDKKDGTGHAEDCLAQLILQSITKPEPITPEVLVSMGFEKITFKTYVLKNLAAYGDGTWGILNDEGFWVLTIPGPTTVAELRSLLKMLGIGKGEK